MRLICIWNYITFLLSLSMPVEDFCQYFQPILNPLHRGLRGLGALQIPSQGLHRGGYPNYLLSMG